MEMFSTLNRGGKNAQVHVTQSHFAAKSILKFRLDSGTIAIYVEGGSENQCSHNDN